MSTESLLTLLSASALLWGLLIILSWLFPHRLFNSVILGCALFLTLVFLISLLTGDTVMAFLLAVGVISLILLLVPLMLIINGITMIRNEGRSFANLLSLLLGIIIEIGELAFIFTVMFNYSMEIPFFQSINMAMLFVGMSVFYFSLLILLFVLYMIYFQYVPHRYDFEYIIIHGCGLLEGDKVSRLLSNRIDKAIQVYHKGGDKAMLICSGGQGGDEKISEAAAIAGYLASHDIPRDHILLEDRSTSTEENLSYSYEIIKNRGGGKRIALISSNYHVYRCVLLARRMNIPCVGIGAKVALYYWPSAVIREFAAVYSNRKKLIWTLLGYLAVISPYLFVLLSN